MLPQNRLRQGNGDDLYASAEPAQTAESVHNFKFLAAWSILAYNTGRNTGDPGLEDVVRLNLAAIIALFLALPDGL